MRAVFAPRDRGIVRRIQSRDDRTLARIGRRQRRSRSLRLRVPASRHSRRSARHLDRAAQARILERVWHTHAARKGPWRERLRSSRFRSHDDHARDHHIIPGANVTTGRNIYELRRQRPDRDRTLPTGRRPAALFFPSNDCRHGPSRRQCHPQSADSRSLAGASRSLSISACWDGVVRIADFPIVIRDHVSGAIVHFERGVRQALETPACVSEGPIARTIRLLRIGRRPVDDKPANEHIVAVRRRGRASKYCRRDRLAPPWHP